MEGNSIEIGVVGQGQITTPQLPQEQLITKENELSLELADLRVKANSRSQKTIEIFGDNSTKQPGDKEPAPIKASPVDISARFEKLTEVQGLTPAEFVPQSKQLLQDSSDLTAQSEAEIKSQRDKIWEHQSSIQWKIDERIRELSQIKGVKRVSAKIEQGRLERQKASLQSQIQQLQTQTEAKQKLIDDVTEQERTLRSRQEKMILAGIGQEVQSIRTEFEQFSKKVLADGRATAEVRNAYIEQVITPQIDKIVSERKGLPPDQKDKFLKALQDCIDHREESDPKRQESRQALNNFFSYESGFYNVEYSCNPLLSGNDESVVSGFVAKIAAESIVPIRAAVYQNLSSWEARNNFEHLFDNQVDKSRGLNGDENLFGRQLLSEVLPNRDGQHIPDMDLWLAVKSSKTVREIFGGMVEQQDRVYYKTILDRSLSDTDGGDIDLLYYYPTPDSVRNLVILAAADYQNYRTVHANWVLDRLQKRPDWNDILNNTEATYPSLKVARPTLETWNWREYSNQPDIKPASGDLAASLFENTEIDKRLQVLATVSLTNDSILDILAKRSVLSSDTAETLIAAGKLLREKEKNWQLSIKNQDSSAPYLSEYYIREALRNNLFTLLENGTGKTTNSPEVATVERFVSLSRMILENKDDYAVLDFLSNGAVIQRLTKPFQNPDLVPVFLNSYKDCPILLKPPSSEFLGEFCQQFEGANTVTFFRNMGSAYNGHEKQLNQIVSLVGKKALSHERALELPTIAMNVLEDQSFSLATEFPKLFLETNDGIEFFIQTRTGSLFSLDKSLEARIGQRIQELQTSGDLKFSELLIKITPTELEQIDKIFSSNPPVEINQLKWQQLLMGYARLNSERWGLPKLSQATMDRLNTLFADPKVRDMCLVGLRDQWIDYLKSGKPGEVPFSLSLMSEFIDYCGGAGPLSQVNSLNTLIKSVDTAFTKETTADRTKLEICQGLTVMEERFTREKWSNEDRADFYNISRDIIKAAPSLFSDYLYLFEKLSPSQLKEFARDIYPLYRTKLVLLEKKDDKGIRSYDKEQLMNLRRDIRNFTEVFNAGDTAFDAQKIKLLQEITGLFKERFGIIKIPDSFSSEHMRSFTNVSTYLANLHGRTTEKETILGYYLSIMINNQWDAFRQGVEINPDELLVPEKSNYIKNFLQERQRLNPLTAENLGLQPEELPEFLKLMQQETSNVVVGNIETIDIKLANVILNLRGLEDLDLYTDPLDKQRMSLLLDYGNKRVGSVVARMYQQLSNPEKTTQFTDEETQVQTRITQIMQEQGLTLTPQALKVHFQDGIRPLSTVVNLMGFIEDTQAEPEITTLKNLLNPSSEVIDIFKRLGEDFKPSSGAIALSQDLSYLDNLVVKREDELKPGEKEIITEYTSKIRGQVVKLEGLYGQIKNKVVGLRQGSTTTTNPLLKDKLDQIDRIINAQVTQQAITSTATDNLNTIIENIRECLSCTKEGCNNDTDLTFGDLNKFYLYSQTETQKQGSISDELVFVEPITKADGSQEVSFVLDRIYGTNTPTILENQIDAILKKYRSIKQRFPGIKLSVFVSDAAITTGGTSPDMLVERFKAKSILGRVESVEVNVAESATGDHYIEFGGSARTAGKRQTNGVLFSTIVS